MAEGGESNELADFDIQDQQYADGDEETSFIDDVMNKNDDSFDTNIRERLTKPPDPKLTKKEIKIHEKQAKEQKILKNNIKVLTTLLENTDHENTMNARDKLMYTKAGIRKLADYFVKLKVGNELEYIDKRGIKHTITTDERGKWRLKSFSTIKQEIGKGGTKFVNELKDLLQTPDTEPQVKPKPIPPMDSEPTKIDRQQAQTQTEQVVSKMLNSEGQIKTILDVTIKELEETGLFSNNAIREIRASQSAVDELAKEKHERFQKIEYLEKERDEAIKRGDEAERKRLEDLEKFQREQFDIVSQEHKNQIERIKQVWRKVITQPESQIPLKERIQLLFKIEGITIIAILTAIGMIVTSLGLGIARTIKPTPTPTPPTPTPPNPNSIPNKVKDGLKQLAKYLWELSKKSAAAIPGIIGSIVSFLLKQMGNVVGFLAEHVLIFLFTAVSFIIYGLIDLGKTLVK